MNNTNENISSLLLVINEFITNYYANCHFGNEVNRQPTLANSLWTARPGKRYVKLFSGTHVTAFVDWSTGDVYKAASHTTPAKHIRGNTNDGNLGQSAFHFSDAGLVFVNYRKV